jgi:secondary thiamine-phosphate synthase enzyme
MRQHQQEIEVPTYGQKLFDITEAVSGIVRQSRISTGVAHLFCRHTSASLIINENADPDVRHDLEAFIKRLVPDGDPAFIHTMEGPDDMSAHIKTALTATSLNVPVSGGRLALGTWQGIFVFEHRVSPHRRKVMVHVVGE